MILYEILGYLWQKVVVDIMFFGNVRYFIIVDYFLKFIEVNCLLDGKVVIIINILKQYFV